MGLVSFLEHHGRVSSQQVSLSKHNLEALGSNVSQSSFDGKVKVWSIDTKTCVATHSETEKAVWSVKWLPKTARSEGFATGGANRSVAFYREATGG